RFSWAKALTSKRPIEVASFLFDLFHMIGSPPTILQSDNGKEFIAQVIKELIALWLSQKLDKWRETTGRDDWSFGLRFVVVAMNNSWCRSHKKMPYELVYRDKPHGNCTLVNELYTNNIFDKEEIPNTIEISDANYEIDLDDDMI
ncbi:12948_t:CDS:2, partial [Gigaspora rosea]